MLKEHLHIVRWALRRLSVTFNFFFLFNYVGLQIWGHISVNGRLKLMIRFFFFYLLTRVTLFFD